MVDRNMLLLKVDKTREYLDFLKRVKKYPVNEYLADPFIYGSAERFLQLTIEVVIDIANHLIADLRLRKPENNREIFEILRENKIIPDELTGSLVKMVQFRNILVHDYVKLDRKIVYDVVVNHLVDVEKFVKVVVEYI
jgi:uncharacterized protein YutE (UPF0331/DUF86 family)